MTLIKPLILKEFTALMLESEESSARATRICTNSPVRALLTFKNHIVATAARTVGGFTASDAIWSEVGKAVDADQMQQIM